MVYVPKDTRLASYLWQYGSSSVLFSNHTGAEHKFVIKSVRCKWKVSLANTNIKQIKSPLTKSPDRLLYILVVLVAQLLNY